MDRIVSKVNNWKNSDIQVFWGEIAPCEHLVQIYEDDKTFLDTLEGFITSGFIADDGVVIIATSAHLDAINERLRKRSFNPEDLIASNQYIPLNAKEILSKILVNNWPDEKLFNDFVTETLNRAGQNNRKVRAFGEMVALLWEQGHNGSTVRLETLWHQLQEKKSFTLYCAYPRSGFTQCANESINKICEAHSKVIDGETRPSTEIYYRNVK